MGNNNMHPKQPPPQQSQQAAIHTLNLPITAVPRAKLTTNQQRLQHMKQVYQHDEHMELIREQVQKRFFSSNAGPRHHNDNANATGYNDDTFNMDNDVGFMDEVQRQAAVPQYYGQRQQHSQQQNEDDAFYDLTNPTGDYYGHQTGEIYDDNIYQEDGQHHHQHQHHQHQHQQQQQHGEYSDLQGYQDEYNFYQAKSQDEMDALLLTFNDGVVEDAAKVIQDMEVEDIFEYVSSLPLSPLWPQSLEHTYAAKMALPDVKNIDIDLIKQQYAEKYMTGMVEKAHHHHDADIKHNNKHKKKKVLNTFTEGTVYDDTNQQQQQQQQQYGGAININNNKNQDNNNNNDDDDDDDDDDAELKVSLVFPEQLDFSEMTTAALVLRHHIHPKPDPALLFAHNDRVARAQNNMIQNNNHNHATTAKPTPQPQLLTHPALKPQHPRNTATLYSQLDPQIARPLYFSSKKRFTDVSSLEQLGLALPFGRDLLALNLDQVTAMRTATLLIMIQNPNISTPIILAHVLDFIQGLQTSIYQPFEHCLPHERAFVLGVDNNSNNKNGNNNNNDGGDEDNNNKEKKKNQAELFDPSTHPDQQPIQRITEEQFQNTQKYTLALNFLSEAARGRRHGLVYALFAMFQQHKILPMLSDMGYATERKAISDVLSGFGFDEYGLGADDDDDGEEEEQKDGNAKKNDKEQKNKNKDTDTTSSTQGLLGDMTKNTSSSSSSGTTAVNTTNDNNNNNNVINQSIHDNQDEMSLLSNNPVLLQRFKQFHQFATSRAPIKHYMITLESIRQYFLSNLHTRNSPAVYEGFPTSVEGIVRGGYRLAKIIYSPAIFAVNPKFKYHLLPNILNFYHTVRDVESFNFVLQYVKKSYEDDASHIQSRGDVKIVLYQDELQAILPDVVSDKGKYAMQALKQKIHQKAQTKSTHQLKKEQYLARKRRNAALGLEEGALGDEMGDEKLDAMFDNTALDSAFDQENHDPNRKFTVLSKNALLMTDLQANLLPIVLKSFDTYLLNKDYTNAFNLLLWCEHKQVGEQLVDLQHLHFTTDQTDQFEQKKDPSQALRNNKIFHLRTKLYAQSDDNTFFHFLHKLYHKGDFVGYKMNSFLAGIFEAIPTIIPPSLTSSSKLNLLNSKKTRAIQNNNMMNLLLDGNNNNNKNNTNNNTNPSFLTDNGNINIDTHRDAMIDGGLAEDYDNTITHDHHINNLAEQGKTTHNLHKVLKHQQTQQEQHAQQIDEISAKFSPMVQHLRVWGTSYSRFVNQIVDLFYQHKLYLLTHEEQQEIIYNYDNGLITQQEDDININNNNNMNNNNKNNNNTIDNYTKYCILSLYNEINPNVKRYDENKKRFSINFPEPITQKDVINFHRVAHKVQFQALQIRHKIERYFPEFCAYPHYISVDLSHDDVFGMNNNNNTENNQEEQNKNDITAPNPTKKAKVNLANIDHKKTIRELWVHALTPSMLNILDDHEQFILSQYIEVEPLLQSSAIDNLPVGLKIPNRMEHNPPDLENNLQQHGGSGAGAKLLNPNYNIKVQQQLFLQQQYNNVIATSQLNGLSSSTIDPLVFRMQNEPINYQRSLFSRFPHLFKNKDTIDSLDLFCPNDQQLSIGEQQQHRNTKTTNAMLLMQKRNIFARGYTPSTPLDNELKHADHTPTIPIPDDTLKDQEEADKAHKNNNTNNNNDNTTTAQSSSSSPPAAPTRDEKNGLIKRKSKYRLFIHHDLSILHAITEAAIDYKLRTAIPYFYTYNSQVMNHLMLNQLYKQLQFSYKSLMKAKFTNSIFTLYKKRFVNNSLLKATKIIDDQYLKTLALIKNNHNTRGNAINKSANDIFAPQLIEATGRGGSGQRKKLDRDNIIQKYQHHGDPSHIPVLVKTHDNGLTTTRLTAHELNNFSPDGDDSFFAPPTTNNNNNKTNATNLHQQEKQFEEFFSYLTTSTEYSPSTTDELMRQKRQDSFAQYQNNLENEMQDDHKRFINSVFNLTPSPPPTTAMLADESAADLISPASSTAPGLTNPTQHQSALQSHAGGDAEEIKLTLYSAQNTLNPRFLKYYAVTSPQQAQLVDGNTLQQFINDQHANATDASAVMGHERTQFNISKYLVQNSLQTTLKLKMPHFYHHDQTLINSAESEVTQYSRQKSGGSIARKKRHLGGGVGSASGAIVGDDDLENAPTEDSDDDNNNTNNNNNGKDGNNKNKYLNNKKYDVEYSEESTTNIMTEVTDDEASNNSTPYDIMNNTNNNNSKKNELDCYTNLFGEDYDVAEPISTDEYQHFKETLSKTTLNPTEHVVFNSQIPFVNRVYSILNFSQKMGALPDRVTYAVLIQAARQRGCYELLTVLSNRQQLSALPYFAEHTAISTCYGLLECGFVREAQQLIDTGVDLPTLPETTMLNLTVTAAQQRDTTIAMRLLSHSLRRNQLIFDKLKSLSQEAQELGVVGKLKRRFDALPMATRQQFLNTTTTNNSSAGAELLNSLLQQIEQENTKQLAAQTNNNGHHNNNHNNNRTNNNNYQRNNNYNNHNKNKQQQQQQDTPLNATQMKQAIDLIKNKYTLNDIMSVDLVKLSTESENVVNTIKNLKDGTVSYRVQYRMVDQIFKVLIDETLNHNNAEDTTTHVMTGVGTAMERDLLDQVEQTSTQKRQCAELSLEQQSKLNSALKLAFDLHKHLDFFHIPQDTNTSTGVGATNKPLGPQQRHKLAKVEQNVAKNTDEMISEIMANTQHRNAVDRRDINRLLLNLIRISWILGRAKPVSFFRTLITRNDPTFDHTQRAAQRRSRRATGTGGVKLGNFQFS